jgi:hypothetical protein
MISPYFDKELLLSFVSADYLRRNDFLSLGFASKYLYEKKHLFLQEKPRYTINAVSASLISFAHSTNMSSFARSDLSSKAKKRLKKHFQRSINSLAIELHYLLTGLRNAFLYDTGALTISGGNQLIQHLQVSLPGEFQSVNDLVVVAVGAGDAIFFVRRWATIQLLKFNLKYKTGPALVDVSPKLQSPIFIPWSNTKQTKQLVEAMEYVLSAIVTNDENDKKENMICLQRERMNTSMISIVGILLEYPVVYGFFQGDETIVGNCAASDTLCCHRLIHHTVQWIEIAEQKSKNCSDTRDLILPWSFTVPKLIKKNVFVRLAIAYFYTIILKRLNNNGQNVPTTQQHLSWNVEEMNVSSVCL